MAGMFNNKGKERPLRKSHYDEYRSAMSQLDEKTKNKLELQRTLGMAAIVVVAIGLFCVLVFTGIGVDSKKSASGMYFTDLDRVLIECFGDSLTEGYSIDPKTGMSEILNDTYPAEMENKLRELFASDGNTYKCSSIDVKNYGQSGSILQNTSYTRLSGNANIVLIMYPANNFLEGLEYEGVLEANIDAIRKQGSTVFLLNYPVLKGSVYENKLEQTNNYISSAAKSMNVELIDVYSYFNSLSSDDLSEIFSSDDLHLTNKGYAILGDYAAEKIHEFYLALY